MNQKGQTRLISLRLQFVSRGEAIPGLMRCFFPHP